jgi:hypothetical protein
MTSKKMKHPEKFILLNASQIRLKTDKTFSGIVLVENTPDGRFKYKIEADSPQKLESWVSKITEESSIVTFHDLLTKRRNTTPTNFSKLFRNFWNHLSLHQSIALCKTDLIG